MDAVGDRPPPIPHRGLDVLRLRHSRSGLAEPGTDVILWARRPEQPLRPAS